MTQLNEYSVNESGCFSSVTSTSNLKKLCIIGLVATCSFTLIGCSESQQEQATQTLGLDEKDVFSLELGSCFNNPNPSGITEGAESDLITEVPIRDCNEAHDNEVFHIFNLPDSATVPTIETVNESVMTECVKAYEAFVGKSYEDTRYDMSYLSPSDETWAEKDREVTCYVYDPDLQKITTSLKGANI